jgi:hypothetical protein
VLHVIASGKAGLIRRRIRSNGFAEHSPGGYRRSRAWLRNILTFMFW